MTRQEVEDIAELKVRQYCDALVDRAMPKMIEAAVRAHNNDIEAHGGVQEKTARAGWAAKGFLVCLAIMGGAGIERIFALLPG